MGAEEIFTLSLNKFLHLVVLRMVPLRKKGGFTPVACGLTAYQFRNNDIAQRAFVSYRLNFF